MSQPSPDDPLQPLDEEAPPPAFPTLEELGALLPLYEFAQIIGQGGMGAVYLAHQPRLQRSVAVKVLPVAAAQNPEDAERFNWEARAMARLSHPHIAAVFEYGQTSAGHLYLAMEYVEGADLHWRTLAGEVTPERARTVIVQLCDALQYAHEHGVIHRDIKPANILITPAWQVKIIDFGLARDMTLEPNPDEAEYGTPDYTAPERLIAGHPVDHRADIYSLGVVIHEILTGKTPLAAGATAGQGLPEGFAGVLSKCLMHDPARRYQSAKEVRTALLAATAAAAAKNTPVAATTTSAPLPAAAPRAQPPRQSRQEPQMVKPLRPPLLMPLLWALISFAAIGYLGWRLWRGPTPAVTVVTAPTPALAPAPAKPTPPVKAPATPPAPTSDQPALSPNKSANNPPQPTVKSDPPAMNKAIPTALALAAATSSVFGVDYQSQVRPIFKAKCFECHSEEAGKEKGKVALDTEEKLKATIGPGQHIIPGEPEKSTMLILCKLPDNDEEVMPPKGKNRLTPAELTLLETWIKEGASLTPGTPAAAPAMAPAADAAPAAPAPVAAAPTSWTSSDGKTIQATFIALTGDQITLRLPNGTDYTFPLTRLSPESQSQAKTAAGQ